MIYLDNNATTVVDDKVLAEMQKMYKELYGNPNSIHQFGNTANRLMEESRHRISDCLNCLPKEVYFTSSATESINWALRSSTLFRGKRSRVVTSAVEHKAVLSTLKDLKNIYDIEIIEVKPGKNGIVAPEKITDAIDENTFMVSLMAVNNVTGAIQPYIEIGKFLEGKDIFYHIDAVQTIGKISLDFKKTKCNFASFSGHKFHGPKGVGILYAKKETRLRPLITGGGQERGMRSGTQNVPGIVGTALALEEAYRDLQGTVTRLSKYRELISKAIVELGGNINTPLENSICNTINFSIPGIRGEVLVNALSEDSVYIGTSSACSSRSDGGQYVLDNMNLPEILAIGAVRLSMSRKTTEEEIEIFVEKLKKMVDLLKF